MYTSSSRHTLNAICIMPTSSLISIAGLSDGHQSEQTLVNTARKIRSGYDPGGKERHLRSLYTHIPFELI